MVGYMGDELKVTEGIVSSIKGFENDIRMYQISNAVQPGNSGGPLVDLHGNVVGIVTSKFVLGENANYALKTAYLTALLDLNDIRYSEYDIAIKTQEQIYTEYSPSVFQVISQ